MSQEDQLAQIDRLFGTSTQQPVTEASLDLSGAVPSTQMASGILATAISELGGRSTTQKRRREKSRQIGPSHTSQTSDVTMRGFSLGSEETGIIEPPCTYRRQPVLTQKGQAEQVGKGVLGQVAILFTLTHLDCSPEITEFPVRISIVDGDKKSGGDAYRKVVCEYEKVKHEIPDNDINGKIESSEVVDSIKVVRNFARDFQQSFVPYLENRGKSITGFSWQRVQPVGSDGCIGILTLKKSMQVANEVAE